MKKWKIHYLYVFAIFTPIFTGCKVLQTDDYSVSTFIKKGIDNQVKWNLLFCLISR